MPPIEIDKFMKGQLIFYPPHVPEDFNKLINFGVIEYFSDIKEFKKPADKNISEEQLAKIVTDHTYNQLDNGYINLLKAADYEGNCNGSATLSELSNFIDDLKQGFHNIESEPDGSYSKEIYNLIYGHYFKTNEQINSEFQNLSDEEKHQHVKEEVTPLLDGASEHINTLEDQDPNFVLGKGWDPCS